MKVFVGYDTREDIAYQVCEHSIYTHSTDAKVVPLNQHNLRQEKWYWRELDKLSQHGYEY